MNELELAPLTDQISILYVDDEEHNLGAFKASFRRKYRIHIANSADEALQMLETIQPHIVIADQRMPGTTGVEFFEKIKTSHPDPIRILLTAYTSSQTVIDAVNKGQIDRYLVKPWNNALMDATLQAGYTMYEAKVAMYKKNEELRKTNTELNRFVYSVSHDLRAPLMSILGLLDLARHESSPEEQLAYFDLMEKSVHKMDNFIHTTLDYYRNFKSDIQIKATAIKPLVQEIIDSLENSNGQVTYQVDISGDAEVYTDKLRLKIALTNLLSNAAKYGRRPDKAENKVEVQIFTDADEMRVQVTDHGIGIPADEMPRIFEMFYRTSNNTDPKSTGLGLYLVKEAVHKMKGSITAQSEENQGSTFSFVIPNQKNADQG